MERPVAVGDTCAVTEHPHGGQGHAPVGVQPLSGRHAPRAWSSAAGDTRAGAHPGSVRTLALRSTAFDLTRSFLVALLGAAVGIGVYHALRATVDGGDEPAASILIGAVLTLVGSGVGVALVRRQRRRLPAYLGRGDARSHGIGLLLLADVVQGVLVIAPTSVVAILALRSGNDEFAVAAGVACFALGTGWHAACPWSVLVPGPHRTGAPVLQRRLAVRLLRWLFTWFVAVTCVVPLAMVSSQVSFGGEPFSTATTETAVLYLMLLEALFAACTPFAYLRRYYQRPSTRVLEGNDLARDR